MAKKLNIFDLLIIALARLFGVMAIIVGCMLELTYVLDFLDDTEKLHTGVDVIQQLFLITFPLVVVFIGWLIIKAKYKK